MKGSVYIYIYIYINFFSNIYKTDIHPCMHEPVYKTRITIYKNKYDHILKLNNEPLQNSVNSNKNIYIGERNADFDCQSVTILIKP